MRGRPRKPTKLKLIEGERKDRINKNEPKPQVGIPALPYHLRQVMSRVALKEWNRVAPELKRLGILTNIDMVCLAAYCQAFGEWVCAERIIKEKGPLHKAGGETKTIKHIDGSETITKKGGSITTSPYVWIRDKALKHMHQFATEFGMTAAARGKITICPEPTEEEGILRFLTKGSKKNW